MVYDYDILFVFIVCERHSSRYFLISLCQSPHQLFEQRGQDVVQRLVADGGVELLKGLGRRLTDLLQGVAQSLPHCGHQGLGEDQHLSTNQQERWRTWWSSETNGTLKKGDVFKIL